MTTIGRFGAIGKHWLIVIDTGITVYPKGRARQ